MKSLQKTGDWEFDRTEMVRAYLILGKPILYSADPQP